MSRYTHRPATLDDAAAAAELMNAFDRAHVEEPDTLTAEDLVSWWAQLTLEEDSRFFFDDGGNLVGTSTLALRDEEQLLDLDAYVHPAHLGRGLGGAMIDWLEEQSRERGLTRARTSALAVDAAAGRLVAARGFAPIRHFYRMSIDLDTPPPGPEWPAGFTVSTLQPEEEPVVYAVITEAFAEHWGQEHREYDEWRRRNVEREWWDPTLVYLVREGGEVVAASTNGFRFGSGWVDTIGTLKPWRGKGLGRALLLTAFGEFFERGERRVALAVDAGNETGATHLYESVGMRIAWQADIYEKHLDSRG